MFRQGRANRGHCAPGLLERAGRPLCPRKGFTLIEMLTVLTILVFLIAFFGRRFVQMGNKARINATQQLINKIGTALALYQAECHALPPDTGYGQSLGTQTSGTPPVVTYDSGSLWRYLAQPVVKVITHPNGKEKRQLGPYTTFKYDPSGYTELQPYDHGKSYYVVDAWGRPIGYVGSPKRVVHNRGFADIYSAGPDGKTAGLDGKGWPGFWQGANGAYSSDGDVSDMGPSAMNGSLTSARGSRKDDPDDLVLDDINNWDPQR